VASIADCQLLNRAIHSAIGRLPIDALRMAHCGNFALSLSNASLTQLGNPPMNARLPVAQSGDSFSDWAIAD
jgi:hypothetical protein